MKLDYGQGEKEIVLSVYTMMLYEQEFGSDIIKDLFGRVAIRRENDDEDVLFAMDYRDTNWTAVVKVLWASLKAADDSVAPFKQWQKDLGAIDLNAASEAIITEAWNAFFRTGASDSE